MKYFHKLVGSDSSPTAKLVRLQEKSVIRLPSLYTMLIVFSRHLSPRNLSLAMYPKKSATPLLQTYLAYDVPLFLWMPLVRVIFLLSPTIQILLKKILDGAWLSLFASNTISISLLAWDYTDSSSGCWLASVAMVV